jgi:hypothetical protein
MTRVLIVGCGGIGSYLIRNLYEAKLADQLHDIGITIVDDDTVDTKNLKYQNFFDDEVFDNKAEALSIRYGFEAIPKKIKKEADLDDYNIIIAAVDDNDLRKLLYKWGIRNPDKFWIDLRSEGRTIAFLTQSPKHTHQSLLATLNEEGGNSCQLDFELAANIIQYGNQIVAAIGCQMLLNHLRGEKCSHFYTRRF